MVNASPDFAAQAEQIIGHEVSGAARRCPVDAVLLTNADLDHVLGLLMMREEPRLEVHATAAVWQTLAEAFSLDTLLASFTLVQWHEVTGRPKPLPVPAGATSSVAFRAIPLPGTPPPFATGLISLPPLGHSVAYEFSDLHTGNRLVVAPDVAEVSPDLLSALQTADAVLFDGTFWSNEELRQVKPGARTAREMGHLPVQDGSLELLRSLPARFKSYLHVNNTNPMLDPDSPEWAEVAAAGIRVEEDGTEWKL